MNWRDMLIGAIITLIVTIVGGVIVYFVGAKIDIGKKTEKLVYQLEPPVTFNTELTKIALLSMKAANLGDLTAKNVFIGVKFEKTAKVLDYKVTLSSGPAGKYEQVSSEDGCYKFHLDALTPGEIINLSFMFEGTNDPVLSVALKSENTTGKDGQISKSSDVKKTDKDTVLFILLPLLVALQAFLFFKLIKKIKNKKNMVDPEGSINNTAFLYLHQGLVDKAKKILEEYIDKNGGSSYELSNYGLCLAASGDLEGSNVQLKAADFYVSLGGNNDAKSIVLFNQAIVNFIKNNVPDGVSKLEKALSLNSNIPAYIKYSKIINDLMAINPDLSKQVSALSDEQEAHNNANTSDAKKTRG